jgi:3-dehydroquinate dehydratase/shikimate dehydrogenase
MSKICLSLTGKTIQENLDTVQQYRAFIDALELRVDYLCREELPDVYRFPELTSFPVILTIRREQDGGMFSSEERERENLFTRCLQGRFAYVDLESDFATDITHDAVYRLAQEKGATVIRSLHDFTGVPQDLVQRVRSLAREPAQIPKASVYPRTSEEVFRLIQASLELGETKRILLGMGEWGFATRVLAPKLNGYLTFCSPEGSSAAPGHIDPQTLSTLYRFRSIGANTPVYGVIGNPVMHSRSPHIHNPGFEKLGLDAVYLPFPVDDLTWFFRTAGLLDIRGVSVTVPFKQAVVAQLDELDASVEATSACNTAVREDGRWKGYNFDVDGFLIPLRELVGGRGLAGAKATVLGAGGVARAVVYALRRENVEVCILNRTVEKARELASSFGCTYAGLDDMDAVRKYADIIVQATSLGMPPQEGRNPLAGYRFSGSEIAYELIYTPPSTPFLEEARQAGCTVLNGERMLYEQARLQFQQFSGSEYPD